MSILAYMRPPRTDYRATGAPTSVMARCANRPAKDCVGCGKRFLLNSGVQRYCSQTCSVNSRIERKHGLAPGEWDRMYAAQEGMCALCSAERRGWTSGNLGLVVDHDHRTGRTRALLCGNCNTALGRFDDDPARLRAAADYLDGFTP